MFPKTNVTSNGNDFTTQNKETGNFTGHIKDIRAIKSTNNPYCFGVIDIEVNGQRKIFQDYLNFNENKAEKSMSYLVQHTKDLILACGKNVDLSAEKDMEWVEKSLNALKESKAEFKFHQGEGPKGLEITFIDAQENPTDF